MVNLIPHAEAIWPAEAIVTTASLLIGLTIWTYYGSRSRVSLTLGLLFVGSTLVIAYLLLQHLAISSGLWSFLTSLPVVLLGLHLILWLGLSVLVLKKRGYAGVPKAQGLRCWLLLALRLAALAVACLILLQPTWHQTVVEYHPATLIILVDSSKSMAFKDEGGRTRWRAAAEDFKDAKDYLKTLERDHHVRVQVYHFNSLEDKLSQEVPWNGEPIGDRTALYAAIDEGFRPFARDKNQRLLGMVVISDGQENTGQPSREPVLARLKQANVPVHTIGMGAPTASELQPDILAKSINAPQVARVKDRMTVTGSIQARRFVGQEIEVRLLIDDKPVFEADNPDKQVKVIRKPNQQTEVIPIELPACKLPDKAGEIKVSLVAKALSGQNELTDRNNSIASYVTLTKEGLSVLYFDRLRASEPKFLKLALKGDERITLYYAESPPDREVVRWRETVRENLRANSYDVFIIGDVPKSKFDADILAEIEKAVSERSPTGAGFLMIGGRESFGNGGWKGTPIERLLPVELNATGQLEDRPGAKDIQFTPTDAGLTGLHRFILSLDSDPQRNKDWWRGLVRLPGGNVLGTRKEDTVELAKADPGGDVLLAVRQYGKGRTAALALDTTWLWVRPGDPRNPADRDKPVAPSESTEAHTRFWRQLILWLAQQENLGSTVRIELDYRRLLAGREQGIAVQAFEPASGGAKQQQVIQDAEFTVKVRNLKRNAELTVHEGTRNSEGKVPYRTKPDAGEEAEYEVEVTARHQNRDLGKATARFMTYIDDDELLNSAANHHNLQDISNKTEGKYTPHGGLRGLLQDLELQSATKTSYDLKFPDWEEPDLPRQTILFLLFVALIAFEWFLRRMWGLV